MTSDPDTPSNRDTVTHVAAARKLGLPPDLLGVAAELGLIPNVGKRSAYYTVVLEDLPPPADIIGAVRQRHAEHLQAVVRKAETVMAEAEAIQLDALEAIESDSGRVEPLGDDTAGFLHASYGARDALSEASMQLRLAVIHLASTQSALEQVDGPRPDPREEPAERDRLFPPGRPRPAGHRRR